MKQYQDLLKTIKEKGTHKSAARAGMPGTTSLFGHQMRFDLSEGFPLITTKKVSFKNIVIELLWFLKGDTNIKYLVDNGCNIWNEDAYNYYLKQFGRDIHGNYDIEPMSFEDFVDRIKNPQGESRVESMTYKLGDCGMQYGKLWRSWESDKLYSGQSVLFDVNFLPSNIEDLSLEALKEISKQSGLLPVDYSRENTVKRVIDQVKDLIKGLKNNPMGRRHIITAWNPATLNDMALNACHALVQFNCRPLTDEEKRSNFTDEEWEYLENHSLEMEALQDGPQFKLDCQMYQRSADVFLGVPYNIASYSLLTEILAKICNMIPGDFIHTFGDVHIYDNHMEQVDLQLTREPMTLPRLEIVDEGNDWAAISNLNFDLIEMLNHNDFKLYGYNPHPAIKAKLSTGLK